MSNNKVTTHNQKHLTQEDRVKIEKALDLRTPFSTIAKQLSKDSSTISKEVKKHRQLQEHNTYGETPNRCANDRDCTKKNICGIYAPKCKKLCKKCSLCHRHCLDYVPFSYHCPRTDKAPFVCNGCSSSSGCRLDKFYYRGLRAHRDYKTVLVDSRTGINISESDLSKLDDTVSPLVKQGQSVYMILQNHPEIRHCEKTIYNYIDHGVLSVKNLDLPKKVKYKIRKSNETSTIDGSGIYEGRTYKDFLGYMKENPDTRIVEMDTVIGCEGSKKVLLTLHFGDSNFMMAYLLDSRESVCVEKVFDDINTAIGTNDFRKALFLVLTDRGTEFHHPEKLECSIDNTIRTSIFYCDPMSSWQKPHCEKNHEYIRKICPKGSTFDYLTQDDVNLMMSHINSSCRKSLGGMKPNTLAKMMLPTKLLKVFGLWDIKADDIVLTPELLKGKIEVKSLK